MFGRSSGTDYGYRSTRKTTGAYGWISNYSSVASSWSSFSGKSASSTHSSGSSRNASPSGSYSSAVIDSGNNFWSSTSEHSGCLVTHIGKGRGSKGAARNSGTSTTRSSGGTGRKHAGHFTEGCTAAVSSPSRRAFRRYLQIRAGSYAAYRRLDVATVSGVKIIGR